MLSPIRFYDPTLQFDNDTTFQNPDNRVSTGYDYEGVRPFQYALPIPKQWPDYQPGIDVLMSAVTADGTFYADLYDEDNALYKSLYVESWKVVGINTMYRCWLDGESGSGIADGYYTVKIFETSGDALIYESEALYIVDWFEDMIPFEYWNFENDFGMVWDNGSTRFTGRVMVPIRLYDPEPQFEKEVYKNDPGVLTTLRTIPQRVFGFDSLAVPVHIAELFSLAFANSELYLDRIKINSEESPEAELIDGSNLKQITGQATFVNFNEDYFREVVETLLVDQSIDWDQDTYGTAVITGNSIDVDTDPVVGTDGVISDSVSYSANDLILVKITLTDDGSSDLPSIFFDGGTVTIKEWGVNWFSYRVNATGSDVVTMGHTDGQVAVYTGVITVYKVT